ncbi:MAG: dTDP-4-dehydrorhamnose reductase, partial [Caulobacteraceae bacterium]|nr:dTDP-4-dehydrorhamnose reductase [Caulobacteraceae bacterium]
MCATTGFDRRMAPGWNGMTSVELWGGHECTVNRIRDRYFDQTRRSGHQDRVSDLDLFAELGVKALRYPVLWERTAPKAPDRCDFSWSDERLDRLRVLGVRPIIGLLHHGSGPRYTSLLDPGLARGLADFARRVAERYPWVEDWTPVNEPLTTARFSALYGHWYPHRRDESAFWLALFGQIEAVALSMAEIRKVIPAARLIQTEDLGRTYATPGISHQAEFDNHRRWMTWDLLCGRVGREHPLWDRLSRFGLSDRVRRLADSPCPPDVIGVNHYLTSDRLLDHRLEAYPTHAQGGNAFVRFADVEAIRVLQPAPAGLEGAMEEAWGRYGRPIALTEVHNGCTREEQVRWFASAWEAAARLRRGGADVRAVTAWSLLGAYDWDSLLTHNADHYEPGAYDVRAVAPRPTALARAIKALGAGKAAPTQCRGPGWWDRDIRLTYGPVVRGFDPHRTHRRIGGHDETAPILIVGGRGLVGEAFARACEWRGLAYSAPRRAELDLADPASVEICLKRYRPWAVINAAGSVRLHAAHKAGAPSGLDPRAAMGLASACAEANLAFVSFSCGSVFGKAAGRPFVETDEPAAACELGQAHVAIEQAVLGYGRSLIVRSCGVFSDSARPHYVGEAVRRLVGGQRIAVVDEGLISPTFAPDLANATLDLLIDGEAGIWHLANGGALRPSDFLRRLAERLGLDGNLVQSSDEYP